MSERPTADPTTPFGFELPGVRAVIDLPPDWLVAPMDPANRVVAFLEPDEHVPVRSNVVVEVLNRRAADVIEEVGPPAPGVCVLEHAPAGDDAGWWRVVGDWTALLPVVQVERIVPVGEGVAISVVGTAGAAAWPRLQPVLRTAASSVRIEESPA